MMSYNQVMLAHSDGTGLLILLIFVPIAIAGLIWHFSRSANVLDQWARENGLRLLEREYRWFVKGPFFWTSSKNQTVYRITVQDAAGNLWRGWARCGGWFLGLWSSKVDVRWDEPPRHTPGFPVVMPTDPNLHRTD